MIFNSIGKHEDVLADQSHVVRQRHPAERDVFRAEAGTGCRATKIGHDISVGEHDAFWKAR